MVPVQILCGKYHHTSGFLCCSGLTNAEKEVVSEFTKMTGVSLSKTYGPNVTHIIASTDENGACRTTLQFLMSILEGRWILKIYRRRKCTAQKAHFRRRVDSGLPSESTTNIIYNAEFGESGSAKKLLCSHRQDEAEALASSNGAKVAAHSWVLDSIAACNLKTL